MILKGFIILEGIYQQLLPFTSVYRDLNLELRSINSLKPVQGIRHFVRITKFPSNILIYSSKCVKRTLSINYYCR